MLKYCKNWDRMSLHLSGNRLCIFMESSLSVEQNHTEKNKKSFLYPFISEVPTAAWLSVQDLHQGKEEGITVFWRKLGFFPRHMAWFHYNSLLQIINSIFKHILRPFGSCWVLARWDNKFIKGLAGTAVPSASSPVKPLFLSSADAFAFIFCCLPWCQMASLPLLYCFSPNNYLANYSALLTSASGTWAPKLQSWSPTRRKW